MNQPRDDDGKASLLRAFLDAVALEAYDRQGTPEPESPKAAHASKPQRDSQIVVGRGIRCAPREVAA